MMPDVRLNKHLNDRPAQLLDAKQNGVKIIGYLPGNYVPEELIYAAGAVPIGLCNGGDSIPVEASLSLVPRIFCPFGRAQIGEMLLKRDPYYGLIDMIISPVTCQHLRKVAEIWEYRGDIEIFKLGIPHQNSNDFEMEYFAGRLQTLRERLQSFTGNEITEERVINAINIYNRIRWLLKQISFLRRKVPSPISSREFISLNHASFYADPVFTLDVLESIYNKLSRGQPETSPDAPRLLLIGPNISKGDYRILDLIEEAGGNIVIEDIFEGIRNYRMTIDDKGDPIRSIAAGYLRNEVPPAFMRYSTQKRLESVLQLIDDFKVTGVIWYELLCCETYDSESYFFSHKLEERNIPMIVLESDFGTMNTGQVKTRVEAFMEMVREV